MLKGSSTFVVGVLAIDQNREEVVVLVFWEVHIYGHLPGSLDAPLRKESW